jgi:7-carboxy-7-deazaguanine synthase
MMLEQTLRLTEIFFSLQGETSFVGLPTVFIRLTGCPLRCQYCDTTYAFHNGTKWTLASILAEVQRYNTRYVTVTGGEPLAQANCFPLLDALIEQGYCVSLETSGALPIEKVNPQVVKIVDIKTPGSAEVDKNRWENLAYLQAHDQLKFVICDRIDYDWAKKIIIDYQLGGRYELLFSPSYQQLEARILADWIVEDQLAVRLQMQLHKILWLDEPGR